VAFLLGLAVGFPILSPMAKIILVEDELTMVQMVAEVLRADGHQVLPFTSDAGVIEAIATQQPDLVITDLYLDKSRPTGHAVLEKARALQPPPTVIIISGLGTVEDAVKAMKVGAFDFLRKPFSLDDLKLCVGRALNYREAVTENTQLRKELKRQYSFNQIVGANAVMQGVFRIVERVADTDTTVLILGESGTGKELVARALHYNSSRSRSPFVPLNCSALPENLLESELFGHRKGAFTGAIADKEGLFHEANGGTIFLDEIGTMPATLQSRLLRVLQEKEVRRVGDNVSTQVDVRVLAATNENLEELIKSGRFREDLFYRLNVVSVQLPPLRRRVDDIPMLAVHFLREKVHMESGQRFRISLRAMETLMSYPWPGNVRELANVIERATVLAEAPLIRCRDLPPAFQKHAPKDEGQEEKEAAEIVEPVGTEIRSKAKGVPTQPQRVDVTPQAVRPLGAIVSLKKFARDQEVNYLRQVLHKTNDNKEEAARLLDISLATLYRKLADDGE